ncbi:hypothetical protein ACSBR2_021549 [Camellia fascicularis]
MGHRELLVSIRFNGPGWQWSGCFLPDHLGDTQVLLLTLQNAPLGLDYERDKGCVWLCFVIMI